MHDRFPSAAGMLVAACLLAAGGAWLPAHGDTPAPAYQRLNLSLTRHHVVPRYEKLNAAAATLRDHARTFCAARAPAGLERLRGAYFDPALRADAAQSTLIRNKTVTVRKSFRNAASLAW